MPLLTEGGGAGLYNTLVWGEPVNEITTLRKQYADSFKNVIDELAICATSDEHLYGIL